MKKKYPNWILNIYEYGSLYAVTFLIVLLLVLFFLIYILDNRIAHIEESINYTAPKQYTSPNLDSFKTDLTIHDLAAAMIHQVYVPCYSHVYFDQGKPYLLEVNLSIRNTNCDKPIYLQSVRYYDTDGNQIRIYLDTLIMLKPLQSIDFLVEQHDTIGGSGANFIIEWISKDEIHEPLMESVMVGVIGTRSVSFVSRGIPIGIKSINTEP